MNKHDYEKLKNKVERAKQDASKAEGALEQMMKRLEVDFGCKDLNDAKELLAKLQKKEAKAKKKYEQALADFNEKWEESEDEDE